MLFQGYKQSDILWHIDNILVVCVGNICRSPIAAAIMSEQYPNKHIDSAGVSAVIGHSADPKAVELMATHHTDINKHIAKQINQEMTIAADLILTMSTNETKWIESQWPHCRGKVFKIGHWLDKDIEDPYGHDVSAFETARKNIISSLELWADKIS
ncbi:MAG: low molecular weight protein-tyrosine-phosphatase [Psychrobacter sp.]|uniref:low molecular weight protein-tyrosine-phosphatase n=1 Tax=Psychrobacter sp. AOP7-B1-24 TaxID=3457645 RepID=UPI003FBA37CB